MKAGAVDVLTKPFHDQEFLDAVRVAVARDDSARATYAQLQSIRQRLATLTRREREVLEHVVTGRLNKQIAADLGTVEKPSRCTARASWKRCASHRSPNWCA